MARPLILPTMSHPDSRGAHSKFFGHVPEKLLVESYSIREVFMTTNNKDTLRGMHYQTPGQAKIITALTGSVVGNVLDANPGSATFGEVIEYSLSADEQTRLFVPGDWALGYRSLEDNTRILYLADADFSPTGDTGIDPFDEELALNWGSAISRDNAILSQKDRELQSWAQYRSEVGA